MASGGGAIVNRTEVDLTGFGREIVVPTTALSHLMYYLSCVNTLLKPGRQQTAGDMRKLCNFKRYNQLTEEEVDKVLLLVFLLSPDVLLNKCLFVDQELCKFSDNEFYELKAVQHRLLVTDALLIGGETRLVHKIMACKRCWLDENYFTPMRHYQERLVRVLAPSSARSQGQPARRATASADVRSRAPLARQPQAAPRRPQTATPSQTAPSSDSSCVIV